jgi:hypothetical protein
LIGSSIGSGLLISRTGRYKVLLAAATCSIVLGGFLMTHLTAHTSDPVLWSWMFLIGIGVGPSMSGFTVVVQNSVSIRQLGVATSTLTFLRQIGGSVGLAIAGTLFSQKFTQKLPGELLAHGVPVSVTHRFGAGAGNSSGGNLTGVGLTAQLRHALPPGLQHFIPNIIAAIDDAFSLAVADVFWLTVGAAIVAFLAVLAITEIPLRQGLESSEGAMGGDVAQRPEDILPVPVKGVAAR